MDKLQGSAAKTKQHPTASQKAHEAQAAALPPANEKLAGAQAQQVDVMKSAEGKKPEPDDFVTLLRAEIAKVMPKKVEDTKDYMKGDDRAQLKGAMTGNINQQKEQATAGIKGASKQAPDPTRIQGKEVTPLAAEPPPPSPPPIGAADAMPAPQQEANVSLQEGKKEADGKLAEANVTTGQLQKANDPRFTAVVDARGEVYKQADEGPKKYRTDENKILSSAAGQAVAGEHRGLAAFKGAKGKVGTGVRSRQLTAKQRDEARRKEVTDHIETIYARTKESVDKKLASLETDVGAMFDRGADAAIAKMKAYVEERFDDRYTGVIGKGRWVKDKFWPLPDSVKAWFDEAHAVFVQELDALVVRVAALVERRLKEAKDEIANAQKEIKTYVAGLDPDLKQFGQEAEKKVAEQFDELRHAVDDKKSELAQSLAQRYKDAYDKGEAALKELKDAHKSLIEKLVDKLKEIIEILRNFKNRIMSMLAQARAAIDLIVSDPIGFLSNLLSAIKQGLNQFVSNIWTHIKAGFMTWLFGSLAEAGVTLPADFSLGSILKLVLQVLGLTYDRIRGKAVKLIGERNVKLLEKAWALISALITGGGQALWDQIKEFVGDLQSMLVDAIQDWVITSVIKAAVTKLATMFNPVGAIIQAIITIYNTVMFFIENINRILDFVQAIISAAYKIAIGDIGSAANWIENALARTIPIIIAFLARLLGLSGVTDKIVGFIKKIQSTVDKAIDKLIEKIVGGIKKLLGLGKEAGKPDDAWAAGVAGIKADLERMEHEGVGEKDLSDMLPRWKEKYGFKTLSVEPKGEDWIIDGSMSPGRTVAAVHRPGSVSNPFRLSWPKPRPENYPDIYLGGRTSVGKSQAALKALFTQGRRDAEGVKVRKYSPTVGGPLYESDGRGGETPSGDSIGITSQYHLSESKPIGPLSQATTPGGGKLLSILRKYGFRANNEGLQADHIKEIQFGGDDVKENLWPLDASTNTGAGAKLAGGWVKYPSSNKDVKISDLKDFKSRKYWFKITSFLR